MPRYQDVDVINFTNKIGNTYEVKDIRPISEQTLSFEIDKKEKDLLDDIASKKEVFGDFGESQSWRIFDLNIVKLTEIDFDLAKIKRIKIPV